MAKFSPKSEEIAKEINILRKLDKKGTTNQNNLVEYDIVVLQNFEKNNQLVCGYFIMPRYTELDLSNPLKVASELVTSLELLHSIGRVHNDIKPENTMTDKNGRAVIIDMGYCEKYSEEDIGTDEFRGSLMFSSIDKLMFKKPTRKDDLVSLAYFLITMANGD